MSSPIISVEHLSKKYRISHQGQRQQYTTLRDVLAARSRNMLSKFKPSRLGSPDGSPSRSSVEEFWALKDVSFDVQQGEVLGIIGRNGAGKSTLLKILSRITDPTEGRVRIRGRVASLLEVGTGFHQELTGRENIYLNGSILGMSRAEINRKFDEIVDFAGVEKFLDTPVKRYSSGMYVRLAFAVAAHLEPEILIVDEVLAVGDSEFQKKCLGKMQDVSRNDGRTVLFVSHNMSAVGQLCNRAILLRGGSVFLDSTVSSVLDVYLSDAESSNGGRFELLDTKMRGSHRPPILKSLTVRRGDGAEAESLLAGEPCSFDIEYLDVNTPEPARIALAIEDSQGQRIMTFATFFVNADVSSLNQAGSVRCFIPSLPLGPGRYLVSVSVGTKSDGLLDSLDGVGWFDVEWNNNFANGEQHHPVYGPVLVQSEWNVNT